MINQSLNILFGVQDSIYLVDCVTMGACNHTTVSQAVVSAVNSFGVEYNNVMAIVSDSAAYCKKAFKDILSGLFPQAFHILCLAHIMHLVGEIFIHWPAFNDVNLLCTMMKSAFFQKRPKEEKILRISC